MKVAVLGCGPAGLFAAHAAKQAGCEVSILSKARKSFMRGAQYLHKPIPGLSGEPFEVLYDLVGTTEGYRRKVYGDLTDILVSPETLVGPAEAWDIREAYDNAWDMYSADIQEWDAVRDGLDGIEADLVLSTIPAYLLCSNDEHQFQSQMIWSIDVIKPQVNTAGYFTYTDGAPVDNLVLCSGDPDDWWYRASRIHGWENTEFPLENEPTDSPHYSKHKVEKPLRTDCTCRASIVRIGRYGMWKKGVLSHEAYYDTLKRLEGAMW